MQPRAIRVCKVLEGNAFEQGKDLHAPLADQPTALVGQQVHRILDFIACDEVVNVLHELFGGGVVLGVPRDADVKVRTCCSSKLRKRNSRMGRHVKVCVRLSSQALIDRGISTSRSRSC